MGKATITAGGATGSYTVKLDTGKATQTARLAKLDAKLAELVPLIATAQGYVSVAFVLEQTQEAAVQTCINAYVAATRTVPVDTAVVKSALDAYTAAATKLQTVKVDLAQEQAKVDVLLFEQAQATKDRATWAALVLEETTQAWCADLTEDATGEVATIEIPDELALVLIAPAAPAPTAADGLLTAREVQSGPQVFWNAAALPGLQRWRPAYRRGVITALDMDADTATVALDAATSSAAGLPVNSVETLEAVPVQYMTCHAQAFEVGDRCVVKFVNRDWAQPRVVGFVDHPKACDTPDLHLVFWKPGGAGVVRDQVMSHSEWGVNQGGYINQAGVYTSLGLTIASRRIGSGITITDASDSTLYELISFYDSKPVILRRHTADSARTSSIGPSATPEGGWLEDETEVVTNTTEVKISFGNTPLVEGSKVVTTTSVYQIFQPPYSNSPNSRGSLVTRRQVTQVSNYSHTWAPVVTDMPALSVDKKYPPWGSWSVMATYLSTGTGETYKSNTSTEDEVVVPMPTPVFTSYSLGVPKKNTPVKPLADLSALPAHVALATPRNYTLASMAATPLDRHALDFKYLPYQIEGLKVRGVGKTYAYAWLEGEYVTYLGPPPSIARVNYHTGDVTAYGLYDWFEPVRSELTEPLPADYMPKTIVLLDDYLVRAENDLTEPYFWLWVYQPSTGVMTRMTNKPGDLGAGFESVIQLNTPTLPPGSLLIGAMRDEVACM